jgi:DNA-directed RNA polymerase I subunit RPA2
LHRFSEEDTAVDYFGKQLLTAGYNYYGNEPMYSGITGEEFAADIYLGVVFYQRLRHMVLDKFQVRTTGPVDPVTRQPVKVSAISFTNSYAHTLTICQGRKRAGGIRFGEMERDALIAHGTSFLLQDRLMNCSDYSTAWVCRTCGSLISLGYDDISLGEVLLGKDAERPRPTGPSGEYCRVCRQVAEEEAELARKAFAEGQELREWRPHTDVRVMMPNSHVLARAGKGGDMDVVAIPYVFRYLCAELASMGIAVSLEVK